MAESMSFELVCRVQRMVLRVPWLGAYAKIYENWRETTDILGENRCFSLYLA